MSETLSHIPAENAPSNEAWTDDQIQTEFEALTNPGDSDANESTPQLDELSADTPSYNSLRAPNRSEASQPMEAESTTIAEIEPEQPDNRAPARLSAAVARVSDALNSSVQNLYANNRARSIARAENQAYAEDARRTAAATEAAQKEGQDAAYATYSENISRSADIDEAYATNEAIDEDARQRGIIMEEAYRMNERFDQKADRKKDRAKAIDRAKNTLLNIGRATRGVVSGTGDLLTLGAIQLENSLNNGIDTAADRIETAKENRKQRKSEAVARKQERIDAREAAKQARVAEREQARIDRETAKQERIDARREAARERAAQAIVRKHDRREKWSKRGESLKRVSGNVVYAIGQTTRRVAMTAAGAYQGGKEAWTTN